MTVQEQASTTRSGVAAWLADELCPAALLKGLSAGALIFVLEIIVVISFAALIFWGRLASALPYGLAFLLVGDALVCAVVAVLSSYRGTIAVEQDAPGAILALAAAGAMAALPVAASADQQLATVVAMIVGTTLVTALFFLVLGLGKLGGLARFLPYPVMGGFLAGTGWLLVLGGVGVMGCTGFTYPTWRPGMAPGPLPLWQHVAISAEPGVPVAG